MQNRDISKKKKGLSKGTKRSVALIVFLSAIALICDALLLLGCLRPEEVLHNLSSWPETLNFLKIILAILFGIIYVASHYLAIMLIYLVAKKRWAKSKLKVELAVIVPTIVLSVLVKLIVLMSIDSSFTTEISTHFLAQLLKAIYDAIGGLQFEGLIDTADLAIVRCIPFYGTSIIAGLIFLSIIGSAFAYEAYSKVQVRVLYAFSKRLRFNTYIFTALNEETLALAHSVINDDADAVIIFAGPALEPFDRHSEECAEVMGNGFLYWSYYENEKATIPECLGLSGKTNTIKETDNKKFYVFAFDTNEKNAPEEEKNADAIFDDVHARKLARKQDALFIHYVLLGKGENDYQAYQKKKEESLNRSQSDLSLWTEAKSIASQASSYIKNCDILADAVPDEKGTRVRSIGFGETARAIVKELYIHSAMLSVNEQGKMVEAPFEADIFDPKSMEIAGFFQMEMPYCFCSRAGEKEEETKGIPEDLLIPHFYFNEKNFTHIDSVKEEEKKDDAKYYVISSGDDRESIRIANSIILNRIANQSEGKTILFVVVYDRRNNIFLTASDKGCEVSEEELIQIQKTNGFASMDEAKNYAKNIYRYHTISGDGEIIAVIVGNREDTFRLSTISQQMKSAHYNETYKVLNDELYSLSDSNRSLLDRDAWAKGLSAIMDYLKGNRNASAGSALSAMGDGLCQIIHSKYDVVLDHEWAGLNLWDRHSNIEAGAYSRTYYKMYCKLYPAYAKKGEEGIKELLADEKSFKDIALLTHLEHARWNRVHIAGGWRQGVKNKPHYTHDCLKPASQLPVDEKGIPWVLSYDFAFVLTSLLNYTELENN